MSDWTRRSRWLVTQLVWNRGEPDPRVLQSTFTLLLVAGLVVRWIGEGPVGLVSWPVAGVLISLVGGIAVLWVPARHLPLMSRSLAVIHIAGVGMLVEGSALGIAAPLVMLPSIWLGLDLGMRGAAIAVGAVTAFVAVPTLITVGTDLLTVERLLLLVGLAGFGAFSTSAALTKAQTAQAQAEAREEELAQAVQVIERNRRSAHAIFETVDIGLALLDTDGEPRLINQPLLDFSAIAYPDGDLERAWIFDESGRNRLSIEDVPTSRARRGEQFDDARVWIGEDERTRRAMSVSSRRVEDSDGNWLGAAVSYTDVTDFMNALQVKDDFVALVSHELRTPLTSIIGYVSMDLEMDELPPMLRKHLEIVFRNAQRLERLVEGLLEEVEYSGRPMPLQKQGTDLAAIVRDCVDAARTHAQDAGVTLDADVPDTLAFTGDPQRLAQLVDNLVSNALKYNEPGGTARVVAGVEAGSVVIRVSDTGIGIAAEDHPHLFTRFFRTYEANRRAIQGAGLGLSVSKSIVDGHEGRIEVESAPGCGSEFRVVFPLHVASLAS
ncbi:cell wall metabolism sensor histidine kinase WalK [Nocardioides sp. SR21]|uniref:sensor histidine kinase n=1 Tax=Nocardioides sp. SR21 TaxID=2919501 RepID=UPI001FAA7393|nr:ATP-binding protein [Nocardioides sp. SR21]